MIRSSTTRDTIDRSRVTKTCTGIHLIPCGNRLAVFVHDTDLDLRRLWGRDVKAKDVDAIQARLMGAIGDDKQGCNDEPQAQRTRVMEGAFACCRWA